MAMSGAYEFSPGRAAAAAAAAELMEPGMTVGLGSGRAVWSVIEAMGARWAGRPQVRVVVASEATYALAHSAGIDVVQLDGTFELDLAVDGADEVDPELRLLKGGGGALLREKIVVSAARRFVVVAEVPKLVSHLGETFKLPVEVVRFGWRDTRRRLAHLLPEAERRSVGDEPYQTDEGHYILDCTLPADDDLERLDHEIKVVPGVVEHGLFLGMAERGLIGEPNGGVRELVPA
jgi:ribose 5-phosphate isomerase A